MKKAFLSAALLILAFPKCSFWPLAWLAFIPLFSEVQTSKHFRTSAFYFYACGFLFFFTSTEWLRHVSVFGWFFVAFVYPVYFLIFGIAVHWFLKRAPVLLSLFAIPSAWAVLEWIRTEIPSWSFGWNLLAYSQAPSFTVIHFARSFGAYGVSWFVLFGNLSLFFLIERARKRKVKKAAAILVSFAAVVALLEIFSAHTVQACPRASRSLEHCNID